MPAIPPPEAFRILLRLSESLSDRPGWVKLSVLASPQEEADWPAIRAHLSDLVRLGYCIPPASGDLVYVNRPGAKLASVARQLLANGADLAELNLERLAPFLTGYPFPS